MRPRSSPRPCEGSIGGTVEAARRTLLVWAARRASGEVRALRSIVCRHRDGRESSGEDELTPRGVRAPTPSSGSERSGGVWRPARPDAAWRQFVLIGRFPAVLMPTNGAPQGTILAWCAPCRTDEPRPVRSDLCDTRLGGSICVATLIKRTLPPLSTHHPPVTPLISNPVYRQHKVWLRLRSPNQHGVAPHSLRASTGEETARRPPSGPPARASALLRCGHLRASHERPRQPHGQ